MRRNELSFFEDGPTSDALEDALEAEAAWPELRTALRESADSEDLGLWRLAENSVRWARRHPARLRLVPRMEPRFPDFPDAA
ncbi:MAG TPA: hypothetical protein VFK05_18655 [Polyangiaceae bacterium]|nr:hypothetical protein [Polyangiaceae bacterium]